MIVRLAGLEFRVDPDERIVGEERAALQELSGTSSGDGGVQIPSSARPWQVGVEDDVPRPEDGVGGPADGAPAEIETTDDLVRFRHGRFDGEADPRTGRLRLRRESRQSPGVEIALRIALACRLPLEGGIPLHAAAVVAEGRGLVFFGPSGAGKTTIAALSPWRVLSDELVAVRADGAGRYCVSSTGFWGELGNRTAPPGFFPLAGLFELEKGLGPRVTRLASTDALRRLLGVVMIPASPALWRPALGVLASVLRGVPAFRLTWSPEAPPWEAVAGAVCEDSTASGRARLAR